MTPVSGRAPASIQGSVAADKPGVDLVLDRELQELAAASCRGLGIKRAHIDTLMPRLLAAPVHIAFAADSREQVHAYRPRLTRGS